MADLLPLNTGTTLDANNGSPRTASTLSTQIIIKVGNNPVGALQRLSVTQNRSLQRIQEIGTDGVIEIVPNSATQYELRVERVVFDLLRLPEAFSRGFRFIAAQRVPFDIEVFDISNANENARLGDDPGSDANVVGMTYKNCWFNSYETPFAADNYVITESANIWCETAFVGSGLGQGENIPASGGLRGIEAQVDGGGVEQEVNSGARIGSLSASGLVNSFFADSA